MADKKPDIHVVPHGKFWAVRKEGAERASSVHDTKANAMQRGRDQALRGQAELVIHGRDGKIQDSDSFGHDQNPPKDKKH